MYIYKLYPLASINAREGTIFYIKEVEVICEILFALKEVAIFENR